MGWQDSLLHDVAVEVGVDAGELDGHHRRPRVHGRVPGREGAHVGTAGLGRVGARGHARVDVVVVGVGGVDPIVVAVGREVEVLGAVGAEEE